MRHFSALLICVIPLGGCASTLNSYWDRPVHHETLDVLTNGQEIETISGDRRIARVSSILENQGTPQQYLNYRVCAETQADAIASRGATTGITVADKASLNDALTESLIKTVERGQVSDVVRQLSWQWCNANINGFIDKVTYIKEMEALQTAAMLALLPAAPKKEGGDDAATNADDSASADGDADTPPKCKKPKKLVDGKCK